MCEKDSAVMTVLPNILIPHAAGSVLKREIIKHDSITVVVLKANFKVAERAVVVAGAPALVAETDVLVAKMEAADRLSHKFSTSTS